MRMQEEHTETIDNWIKERHYLRSVPPGARLRLAFYDDIARTAYKPYKIIVEERLIGAMMWGRPSARLLNQETILELTRMFFIDDTEHCIESKALAMARKYIRKRLPKIRGLLAYSSTGENHKGIIYSADNWFQFGIGKGHNWNSKSRTRKNIDNSDKIRWLRSP